jgi:acyl-CoA synthetase
MASPITHITGYCSGINFPFVTGLSTAMMERWDPTSAVTFIDRTRCTVGVGATPFLKELLDASKAQSNRLPSMRFYICGGAAVPPQLIYRTRDALENCLVFRVYGSTELPIITMGWPEASQAQLAAETDGKIYNYDVRILDDDGKDITEIGAEGEIASRGSAMMLGYKNSAQDEKAYIDGVFLTGDVGILTADHALVITDRKRDIIIRGGENISAKEIEDMLHNHPSIAESAIVSRPHPRLGQGVFVYVIVRPGHSEPDLAEIIRFSELSKITRQKIPEGMAIVENFPRTASGKAKKDQLRIRLKPETENKGSS